MLGSCNFPLFKSKLTYCSPRFLYMHPFLIAVQSMLPLMESCYAAVLGYPPLTESVDSISRDGMELYLETFKLNATKSNSMISTICPHVSVFWVVASIMYIVWYSQPSTRSHHKYCTRSLCSVSHVHVI